MCQTTVVHTLFEFTARIPSTNCHGSAEESNPWGPDQHGMYCLGQGYRS